MPGGLAAPCAAHTGDARLALTVDETVRLFGRKAERPTPIRREPLRLLPVSVRYLTVTDTATDEMPLATTCSVLAPLSIFVGTSKLVDTIAEPVATPMVL